MMPKVKQKSEKKFKRNIFSLNILIYKKCVQKINKALILIVSEHIFYIYIWIEIDR